MLGAVVRGAGDERQPFPTQDAGLLRAGRQEAMITEAKPHVGHRSYGNTT